MTAPPARTPQLKRVVPPFTLLLPDSIGGTSRLWLRAGEVVDVADPFIEQLVAGQAHKLVDVTGEEVKAGVEATPFASKLLDNARTAWLKKNAPSAVPGVDGEPAKAKPKGATGIQKPDQRPRATATT